MRIASLKRGGLGISGGNRDRAFSESGTIRPEALVNAAAIAIDGALANHGVLKHSPRPPHRRQGQCGPPKCGSSTKSVRHQNSLTSTPQLAEAPSSPTRRGAPYLYTDPTGAAAVPELDEYLQRQRRQEHGVMLPVAACCIDSGYQSQAVNDFCCTRYHWCVFAVKNDRSEAVGWWGRLSQGHHHGPPQERSGQRARLLALSRRPRARVGRATTRRGVGDGVQQAPAGSGMAAEERRPPPGAGRSCLLAPPCGRLSPMGSVLDAEGDRLAARAHAWANSQPCCASAMVDG